ncbi:MAG: hypothetical protein ACRDJW_11325 [Thermomicrobiales bacterium]
MGGLLSRVAARIDGEGVVLLDGRACAALALPTDPAEIENGSEDHLALTNARAAGWQASRLSTWTTFYGDKRPTIQLGLLPAMINPRLIGPKEDTRHPMVCASQLDTVAAFRKWHERVGYAYRGTPALAGSVALQGLADAGKNKNGGRREPTWRPKYALPDGAYELPYKLEQWKQPPGKGHRFGHGFDVALMYLAAAGVTPLTPWDLRPTGRVAYRPDLSGWWLVEIAPWQYDSGLPDPAGYTRGETGPVWRSGPTLNLLDQLVEEGIHGGYTVLDSVTAEVISAANGRPLKPWSDTLRDAIATCVANMEKFSGRDDERAVYWALKMAYKEGLGYLANPDARAQRPDWYAAVIAQARANLWRKMKKIADTTKRTPMFIETDCVWYSAETSDAEEAWQEIGAPAGYKLGKDKPGVFDPEQTRQLVKKARKVSSAKARKA